MGTQKDSSGKLSPVSCNGTDPGAARHGNFINYYQFHTPESRIKLLPTDIWSYTEDQVYHALDIGCNAGNLTQDLYEFIKNTICCKCKLIGIDIDPLLIERAILHNKYSSNVIYKCINIMNENEKQLLLSQSLPCVKKRYDAIFCFSVTMWIHLNHGDEGLKQFLKFLCSNTDMLIIEPQPWKCYRTALRRMKRSNETFELFQSLRLRNNIEEDIEEIITSQNFIKLTETSGSDWGRKIVIYKRKEYL